MGYQPGRKVRPKREMGVRDQGLPRTTAWKRSGRRLLVAPMVRPPAERPEIASCWVVVYLRPAFIIHTRAKWACAIQCIGFAPACLQHPVCPRPGPTRMLTQKVLGAGNQVGEGVLLLLELAVLVPFCSGGRSGPGPGAKSSTAARTTRIWRGLTTCAPFHPRP